MSINKIIVTNFFKSSSTNNLIKKKTTLCSAAYSLYIDTLYYITHSKIDYKQHNSIYNAFCFLAWALAPSVR